jgi:hypothetical protein
VQLVLLPNQAEGDNDALQMAIMDLQTGVVGSSTSASVGRETSANGGGDGCSDFE